MNKEKKHLNCPNCGEPLSMLEYESQECYECGWPSMDNDTADTSKQHANAPEHTDIVGGLTPFIHSNFITKN